MKKIIALASLGIAGIAGLASMPAHAESTYISPAVGGATPSVASAHLDFSIVIPQVLFLRIGTSSGNTATDGTTDALTFTVPAASIGNGVAIAGTGGDLTAGAVTVRVYGNGGNINLNSVTTGPMTNGTETIPWSQISVAGAALASTTSGFTNAAITHPAFNTGAAGGSGTLTALTATNRVVRVEGKWTYSYLNATLPAAGTYGTSTNKGRVTYTATQL